MITQNRYIMAQLYTLTLLIFAYLTLQKLLMIKKWLLIKFIIGSIKTSFIISAPYLLKYEQNEYTCQFLSRYRIVLHNCSQPYIFILLLL